MVIKSQGYSSNNYSEIRSHSSVLYNERVAILFYLLDMNSIEANNGLNTNAMKKCKSILYQIWKNIRSLVRNNPGCRRTLNLDTKENGVYTIDVAFNQFDMMLMIASTQGFTVRTNFIMTSHINNIELIMRDILQYFNYFVRPQHKNIPDISQTANNYKTQADKLTAEQLKEVMGKRNKIDFEGLGFMQKDEYLDFKDSHDDAIEKETDEDTDET